MLGNDKIEFYKSLIGKEKAELFSRFCALLREYNGKYNLTSITDEAEIYEKHFLDSVLWESEFPFGASVLEVGSGGGFPSIPLKIVRDDLSFTLLESVGKKCEFLRAVVDNLHLKNIQICNMRAEDAAKDEKYREKFDVCCARAVARMNTLSEYCLPFVKVGGKFVAYKGKDDGEFSEAKRAYSLLGGKEIKQEKAELPSAGERTLIVVEKIKKTDKRYPRGQGKERKQPL